MQTITINESTPSLHIPIPAWAGGDAANIDDMQLFLSFSEFCSSVGKEVDRMEYITLSHYYTPLTELKREMEDKVEYSWAIDAEGETKLFLVPSDEYVHGIIISYEGNSSLYSVNIYLDPDELHIPGIETRPYGNEFFSMGAGIRMKKEEVVSLLNKYLNETGKKDVFIIPLSDKEVIKTEKNVYEEPLAVAEFMHDPLVRLSVEERVRLQEVYIFLSSRRGYISV